MRALELGDAVAFSDGADAQVLTRAAWLLQPVVINVVRHAGSEARVSGFGKLVTTSWADPDEGGAALAVMQNARFYNHAALAKQTVIATTVSGFDVWSQLSLYDELISAEVLP